MVLLIMNNINPLRAIHIIEDQLKKTKDPYQRSLLYEAKGKAHKELTRRNGLDELNKRRKGK